MRSMTSHSALLIKLTPAQAGIRERKKYDLDRSRPPLILNFHLRCRPHASPSYSVQSRIQHPMHFKDQEEGKGRERPRIEIYLADVTIRRGRIWGEENLVPFVRAVRGASSKTFWGPLRSYPIPFRTIPILPRVAERENGRHLK